MPAIYAYVALTLSFLFITQVWAIAPAVPIAVGILSLTSSSYYFLRCRISQCCDSGEISLNKREFAVALKEQLYGQPYAQSAVAAIADHLDSERPQKALVLSLHGPTGTGKNYFASILRRHLFRAQEQSKFWHLFSATVHFPHREESANYKQQIQSRIREAVSDCPRSVFVFDEVEKMPENLLDALLPYVDYHANIDGLDFRRAIFIFLSNDGSELIMRKMVRLRTDGADIHSIPREQFDVLLSSDVFRNGSQSGSRLLSAHLVSRFVPFLPLEKQHVRLCIRDELRRLRGSSEPGHVTDRSDGDIVDKVLQSLPFVPTSEEFFSSHGCKRVADKVAMVMEEMQG